MDWIKNLIIKNLFLSILQISTMYGNLIYIKAITKALILYVNEFQIFDPISLLKNLIELIFWHLKENLIPYNFARNSLVQNLDVCWNRLATWLKIATWLALDCFSSLTLYLDKFLMYFHENAYYKVIIRILKVIFMNIIS